MAILKCPSCAAPLSLPDDGRDVQPCPYCNTPIVLSALLGQRADPGGLGALVDDAMRVAQAMPQIQALLAQRKKIDAIKLFREKFGVGLKEAKEAVEAIEAGRPIQWNRVTIGSGPGGQFSPGQKKSSAAVFIILGVVFLLAILAIVISLMIASRP